MPYSLDLRNRAVSSVYGGMKKTEVCKVFNICRQTLYSWLGLKKTQGHLNPQIGFQNGHSHGIKDLDTFCKFVELHSDYTQEEIANHFKVGSSTIGRVLKKMGYTRKKRVKHILTEVKKNEKNF